MTFEGPFPLRCDVPSCDAVVQLPRPNVLPPGWQEMPSGDSTHHVCPRHEAKVGEQNYEVVDIETDEEEE